MTFGEKLFKLRKEKGLSQEQLAWQVNTTRQAVSKWENDQGFPETEKLMMLGNIFSVSIDYLLKNGGEAHSRRQTAIMSAAKKPKAGFPTRAALRGACASA